MTYLVCKSSFLNESDVSNRMRFGLYKRENNSAHVQNVVGTLLPPSEILSSENLNFGDVWEQSSIVD